MAVKIRNLATPVSVSRAAGDSFQREIVTWHHCQSPFMTQTNIQQHSEAEWQSIILVWHHNILPGRLVMAVEFSNLVAPLRVSRVTAGYPFQREIVTQHHCQSPFMTQTNIQQHSGTVEVHHLGVA